MDILKTKKNDVANLTVTILYASNIVRALKIGLAPYMDEVFLFI